VLGHAGVWWIVVGDREATHLFARRLCDEAIFDFTGLVLETKLKTASSFLLAEWVEL
jgi:hypothetical protein